ncbi:MAG: ribonuclease P protein component [Deltaproteobacteria bacterium]|nr:ribonuclease P protein component [Deltaproteobacteria bacterium]
MGKHSFGKDERVRKRRDFQQTYSVGERIATRHFVILLNRNPLGTSRLGITVTKKIGSSVTRNRIKRLVREFFRLNKEALPASHDIIFIARRSVVLARFHDVCEDLKESFRQHSHQ